MTIARNCMSRKIQVKNEWRGVIEQNDSTRHVSYHSSLLGSTRDYVCMCVYKDGLRSEARPLRYLNLTYLDTKIHLNLRIPDTFG